MQIIYRWYAAADALNVLNVDCTRTKEYNIGLMDRRYLRATSLGTLSSMTSSTRYKTPPLLTHTKGLSVLMKKCRKYEDLVCVTIQYICIYSRQEQLALTIVPEKEHPPPHNHHTSSTVINCNSRISPRHKSTSLARGINRSSSSSSSATDIAQHDHPVFSHITADQTVCAGSDAVLKCIIHPAHGYGIAEMALYWDGPVFHNQLHELKQHCRARIVVCVCVYV
jgi:hypothetical protein